MPQPQYGRDEDHTDGGQLLNASATEDRKLGASAAQVLAGPAVRSAGALICAVILLVVGVAHSGALGNHFFGSDTWPWLVSTHLTSMSDVGRVAFSPIMSGTRFASEVALFYHPLTALSYSLDQAVFGLDPLGFYATNLLIHLVAVGALFGLARALGSSWWAAAAAALILGLHPIAAATVPSLPRRQDMVVAALLLLSLNFLARAGLSAVRVKWSAVAAALALFFLALGGKEIAYAALPAVAVLALTTSRRLTRAVPITLSFLALEVVAFAIRWRILGGLGGYYGSESVRGRLDGLLEFYVRPYVTDVLWPFQPVMPDRLRDWLLLLAVVLAVVIVALAAASGQRRTLAAFGLVWQASFLALYAAVHTSLSAYLLYVPLAGFALLVAAVLDAVGDRLRSNWSEVSVGGVATTLSGFGAAALLLGVLWTSPLRASYSEFRDASFVSDEFIRQAIPCIASAPPDAPVVVAGLPHAIVYGTPESQFMDAFVFERYSLESVLRVYASDVTRSVEVLDSQEVVAPPTTVNVSCRQDQGRWLVETRIA